MHPLPLRSDRRRLLQPSVSPRDRDNAERMPSGERTALVRRTAAGTPPAWLAPHAPSGAVPDPQREGSGPMPHSGRPAERSTGIAKCRISNGTNGTTGGDWLGRTGRSAVIAHGEFPRPARRTRRACLHAPGAPCALPVGQPLTTAGSVGGLRLQTSSRTTKMVEWRTRSSAD